jgi:hypothetical protein
MLTEVTVPNTKFTLTIKEAKFLYHQGRLVRFFGVDFTYRGKTYSGKEVDLRVSSFDGAISLLERDIFFSPALKSLVEQALTLIYRSLTPEEKKGLQDALLATYAPAFRDKNLSYVTRRLEGCKRMLYEAQHNLSDAQEDYSKAALEVEKDIQRHLEEVSNW